MMCPATLTVTIYDVIGAGLVCGLGPRKTLDVYRGLGGAIRDEDFISCYRELSTLYRRQMHRAVAQANGQNG